jgi:hypothetical protein
MTTKITEKNISSLANAGVNWQSVVVADGSTGLTAVAGRGYFIDTTSGAQTITLPTSANVGDVIVLKDYARTWGTNNVTIASNLFDGSTNSNIFSTNGQTITLVYMDNTKGWSLINEDTTSSLGATFTSATGGTITTSGNFKIHSFTGDGSFVVSTLGNPIGGGSNVDYLVVAGAGAGGGNNGGGGGGGAGGYRTTFPSPGCNAGSFPITATTYPITVGAGGASTVSVTPNCSHFNGNPGSNSIFSTITSTGGGGGGSAPTGTTAPSGGSGGGGGKGSPGSAAGGAGNTPPVSPSQGNSGGAGGGPGNPNSSNANAGGGGGGAGTTGKNAGLGAGSGPTYGGDGGDGAPNSITGSSVIYGAGGGGNVEGEPSANQGRAGSGEPGGRAGVTGAESGQPGTANRGHGGGGIDIAPEGFSSGAGGKGIVIIRYKFQ